MQMPCPFFILPFSMKQVILKLITEKDSKTLERIAKAQEEIVVILKKQQPGKFSQVLATGATVATTLTHISIVDVIIKWIGG
jgi:hypothetical protein